MRWIGALGVAPAAVVLLAALARMGRRDDGAMELRHWAQGNRLPVTRSHRH